MRSPHIHFRFRAARKGAHVHVDVFIGRAGRVSTHGKSGTLVMREDEFEAWRSSLSGSIDRGEADILEGGHDGS